MTRLLVLSPKFLYPLTEGGSVATHHMVHELVRRGVEVHFAAPYGLPGTPDGFPSEVVIHRIQTTVRKTPLAMARNLFRPRPYYVEKFFSSRGLDQLNALMARERFNVIQTETLFLAPYAMELRRRWGVPVVLRQQNVESDIVGLYRDRARNPLVRWYAGYEYDRLARYEAELLADVDLVVPLTPEDERAMRSIAPGLRSKVVPVGIDCGAFEPVYRFVPERVLLFTNARWPPNRDSVTFFLAEILPLLLRRRPGLRVLLAGNETDRLRKLVQGRPVDVLGFIPDLNTLPQLASVSIVPLRIGSGIRIKLLHQMALGLATVSTTLGAAGTGALHGRHLMIADSPEEFSTAICALLDDPERAGQIGRNAREYVEKEFSVSAIGDQYLSIYASLARHPGGEIA